MAATNRHCRDIDLLDHLFWNNCNCLVSCPEHSPTARKCDALYCPSQRRPSSTRFDGITHGNMAGIDNYRRTGGRIYFRLRRTNIHSRRPPGGRPRIVKNFAQRLPSLGLVVGEIRHSSFR